MTGILNVGHTNAWVAPANNFNSEKAVLLGTHRICPPEETLMRVQPFLTRMGITRIAEITQLDEIGIPVFQAIRPNSRNISISQGKGITEALAKVSAVMEAIETWHAEQPEILAVQSSVGDMAPCLPYSLFDLPLDKHHLIHNALELSWFPARLLDGTRTPLRETFVPADLVRLDFTVKDEWELPMFRVSSNGLASGNTFEEAILHALYEVIERDTFERARRGILTKVQIEPGTVDGAASAPLLEHFLRAGVAVRLYQATGPTGIACFEVFISSASCPILVNGYGCHLDRDVALSRALTEAAQSRLGFIAGSRDDIGRTPYKKLHSQQILGRMRRKGNDLLLSFRDTPSAATSSLETDLLDVLQRILSMVDCPPLVVDLTHKEFHIPVVFVIVPTLHFLETLA